MKPAANNQLPNPTGGEWQQLNRQRRSYLMSDFCRISLPIRNPGHDTAEWVRTNGNRTYVIHPQTLYETGKGATHIWPYGKKARLLMVWISTQVVRQRKHNTSRIIMLPSTLRQLMEDLGIHRKPRKTDYEDFRHQISAISNFHMTITETKTISETTWQDTKNITLAEQSHIGWSKYTPKGGLTEGSYIQLTPETWNKMTRSTPLSSDMVEILTATGRGTEFDIYAWLSQRVYALNHSHTFQTPPHHMVIPPETDGIELRGDEKLHHQIQKIPGTCGQPLERYPGRCREGRQPPLQHRKRRAAPVPLPSQHRTETEAPRTHAEASKRRRQHNQTGNETGCRHHSFCRDDEGR